MTDQPNDEYITVKCSCDRDISFSVKDIILNADPEYKCECGKVWHVPGLFGMSKIEEKK